MLQKGRNLIRNVGRRLTRRRVKRRKERFMTKACLLISEISQTEGRKAWRTDFEVWSEQGSWKH